MDHSLVTVFYENPYWVGVVELTVDNSYSAARIVFGAEPSDEEVLAYLAKHHPRHLRFTSAVAAVEKMVPAAVNPKRRQRQASKLLDQRGASTKAQEALQQSYQQNKQEQRRQRRTDREVAERQKYLQKLEKKKQKKNGR